MKCFWATIVFIPTLAAAAPAQLEVAIQNSIQGHFPADSVACLANPAGGVSRTGKDISPGVSWSAGPAGTKSYALIMTDPDVPVSGGDPSQPGTAISADAPRRVLYHWILMQIPATMTGLPPGTGNKYAELFGGPKPPMPPDAGQDFSEYGYGGPCPPVQDLKPHHYRIRIFAVDVVSFPNVAPIDGASFEAALASHLLAEGEADADYATNPSLNY